MLPDGSVHQIPLLGRAIYILARNPCSPACSQFGVRCVIAVLSVLLVNHGCESATHPLLGSAWSKSKTVEVQRSKLYFSIGTIPLTHLPCLHCRSKSGTADTWGSSRCAIVLPFATHLVSRALSSHLKQHPLPCSPSPLRVQFRRVEKTKPTQGYHTALRVV